jgi:hypothetical protein
MRPQENRQCHKQGISVLEEEKQEKEKDHEKKKKKKETSKRESHRNAFSETPTLSARINFCVMNKKS